MPWLPELFSAPVLERVEEKWQRKLDTVPFFDGLMTGELDALTGSFSGAPELHHPVRGRIRGTRAFEAYVSDTKQWFSRCKVSVQGVEVFKAGRRGCGEVVLHVEAESGRVELPVAVIADRDADGRIDELRVYYSSWPLSARHANRPPLLQPDPGLRAPDIVAAYQAALSAGDLDAIVAAFEPDGYAREPAGGRYVHRGLYDLRGHYQLMFSGGGGISLEHCALVDDQRACALEYNVVGWGRTKLMPEAGVATYIRGESGKLAAVRIYDDVDPPIAAPEAASSR